MSPYIAQGLPFEGSTSTSRHASWTGAQAAAPTRAAKTKRYVELLKQRGPMTDQDVQQRTGWPLSSVNSIRNGLGDLVVESGYETQVCGNRTTRRTRWAWGGA